MSRHIITKDDAISKLSTKSLNFLSRRHDIERSGTFLEIKDANGRAFCYVSAKDCSNESKTWGNENVEVTRIDEAFCNMVERMSDKGTPRTSL